MTTHNPASGIDPAFTKTMRTIQHDAVLLQGMLEGIDLMQNEGARFEGPRITLTMVALRMATRLVNDLDAVTP